MSSVQVAVRARPLSAREESVGTPFAVEMKDKSTILRKSGVVGRNSIGRSTAKEFVYDHCYWSVNRSDDNFVDQEQVFAELGVPVLQSAFQGYNACVFAYGQTGSGKTYTMMGLEEAPGLVPRICEGLYSWMAREKMQSGEQVSYKTEVSYMEIYNEKVRDLLHSNNGKAVQQHNLRVREHPKEGPYVEGLSKHAVNDYVGISELIEFGNCHRATASTMMNDTSSRSHAIFTIKFIQAQYHGGLPGETVSKIHLVDLAGSERASATGAEGERLKEGGSINRSLVCLGTVISALADISGHTNRQKKPYIPYRDSVLTWLLKDSLGGNSKTIMIATISPAESSYAETLSTLRYSSRAKNIINKPTVNEDPNVKLIRDLRAEIQRLKSVINTGNFVQEAHPESNDQLLPRRSSLAEDIHKKEEQVAELTKVWAQKWTDIQRIIEEHHLALHSEGVKMVVDSKQPHFVGVDSDILSTGLVFYYLKDGGTSIGARSISHSPDIAVNGNGINSEHCQVECKGHRVVLHPTNGDCFVNHKRIRKPTKLSQGDLVQLGDSTVFRFNNPHEADKLRRRHSEGLLSPRKKLKQTLSDEKTKVRKLKSQLQSPSSPVTSCTMTVELKSRSTLSTKAKKKTESSLTLNRPSHCDSQLEMMRVGTPTSSPRLESSSPEQHCSVDLLVPVRESDTTSVTSRRSWCFSLLVWMTAPLLLSIVSAFTFPLVLVLALLLFCMKLFGLSQQFRLLRWLGTPMAVGTTIVVSPIAGICDVIFRITFSMLTSLGFVQEPAQSQRPASALSLVQK